MVERESVMAESLPEVVPVNIISGFLGAGKTTLINKLLDEGYGGQGCALIENEFGDVPIDDSLVQSDAMDVRTLAQGCICCTLKVDFVKCLRSLVQDFHPTRIIIEPTGIASASQIVDMCKLADTVPALQVESVSTIIDISEVEEMIDFEMPPYLRQLDEAKFILLSRSQLVDADALERGVAAIRRYCNRDVVIESRSWEETDAMEIMEEAAEAFAQGGFQLHHGGPYSLETESYQDGVGGPSEQGHFESAPDHDSHHDHECGHHHEVEGFASYAFHPQEPFDEKRLGQLRSLLANPASGMVLRAKGFLQSCEGNMLLYQMVHGSDSVEPASYHGEQKFVIIGRGVDCAEFESLLGHHRH